MRNEKLRDIVATARATRKEMDDIKKNFCLEPDRYVAYEAFAKLYNNLARDYEEVIEGSNLDRVETRKLLEIDWRSMKAAFQETYTKLGIIENLISATIPTCDQVSFNNLIHPQVHEVAMRHYLNGDFRNAVLDSITCVFDKIRQRSGRSEDGDRLINEAFRIQDPCLIVSDIESESGQNDQKGFMEICRGLYRSVRNPKAHSLEHDLDEIKAAQYLVLSSILMRRVMEAKSAQASNQ